MAWNRMQADTERRRAELRAGTQLAQSRLAARTQLDVAKTTSRAETERRQMEMSAAKEARVPVPRAETPYLPEDRERGSMGKIMQASPEELRGFHERMPVQDKPIHMIRGTQQSYFNPNTRQEYGDLRTAMTGFKPRSAGLKSEERRATAGLKSQERRATEAEAGQMSRVTLGAERDFFKEQATWNKGERDFDFKVNQARSKSIEKQLELWLGGEGFKSSVAQQEIKSNDLANKWDEANLSPDKARALISTRPVKLRRNKRTGEERWFNAYGEIIEPEEAEEPMQQVPVSGFGGGGSSRTEGY